MRDRPFAQDPNALFLRSLEKWHSTREKTTKIEAQPTGHSNSVIIFCLRPYGHGIIHSLAALLLRARVLLLVLLATGRSEGLRVGRGDALLLGPLDQVPLHGVGVLAVGVVLGLDLADPGSEARYT